MTLEQFVRALRMRLLLLVLLVAVGIGAAYGFSREQRPVYQSTVTLVINAASPNSAIPYVSAALGSGQSTLQTLAGTYSEYLQSGAFTKLVIEKLKLPVQPRQVGEAISSALVGNTNFFHITVNWNSAAESARIANGIATLFIAQNQQVLQQPASSGPTNSAQAALEVQQRYYALQVADLQAKMAAIEGNKGMTAAEKATAEQPLEQKLLPMQDTYTKILASLVSSPAATSNNAKSAQVIDPAGPGIKIAPILSRNLLFGGVAGVAVGIGLVVLLEYLDYTIKSAAELQETLGAPALGGIGLIDGHDRSTRLRRNKKQTTVGAAEPDAMTDSAFDPKLVTVAQPMGHVAESFRLLRTMLDFSNVDDPPRTLLVTSTGPGEGKTLISSNLAVAIAQAGKRVILVDADLRRPSIHREFGLDNRVGLTNLIAAGGEATLSSRDGYFQDVAAVPGLVILTSGPLPPNPSELLGSTRAGELFRHLAGIADVVIYDTPPGNVLSDASVLATRVAGVIVLARAGATRRDAVQHLAARLQAVGAHVVGGVLNMVPAEQLSGYYAQRYYYQPGEGVRGNQGEAPV
ncbi:MAG: polysaccharide biosynthesis tyrosine autokinase [Chloroflexi bacterium]|nr:polysaccharide biosynthesis tyrosine autokinase [Chloroflexota bacterium]